MPVLRRIATPLVLCLVSGLTLVPMPLAAQDLLRLVQIDALAQEDPAAALPQVEAALADPAILGDPADLRIRADLLALRAGLLERLGALRDAAEAWRALADLRAAERATLRADPVPDYERAADLFAQAGRTEDARAALEAAILAEQETGRFGDRLARLEARLAGLGDPLPESAPGSGPDFEIAPMRPLPPPVAVAPDMPGAPSAGVGSSAGSSGIGALNLGGLGGIGLGGRGASGGSTGAEEPVLEMMIAEAPPADFVAVDVYYATDRARTGWDDPARFYGANRSDRLELGVATVTIPDSHLPGQVERPSVWRLDFRASPSRHMLLDSVSPLDPEGFFGRLQAEFTDPADRDLFVYVHGFNHSWEYAIQRGAQLAHDMGNAAVPVVFTWPSRDTTLGYVADAAVVRLSGRRLAAFLEEVVARSGASTIHVLAHSMGSRAVADALEILALKRPQPEPLFGQVLFAAPDVDAQLFAAQAQVFRPLARRVSLYASSNDWALVSSRKLHGEAPRAGMGGNLLAPSDAFDSVDMSALGEDMLMHNYFSNDSSALADMMTLFWADTPPDRRCGLAPRAARSGTVWDYRVGLCPANDLMGVIAHLRNQRVRDLEAVRALVPGLLPEPARAGVVLPVLERALAR